MSFSFLHFWSISYITSAESIFPFISISSLFLVSFFPPLHPYYLSFFSFSIFFLSLLASDFPSIAFSGLSISFLSLPWISHLFSSSIPLHFTFFFHFQISMYFYPFLFSFSFKSYSYICPCMSSFLINIVLSLFHFPSFHIFLSLSNFYALLSISFFLLIQILSHISLCISSYLINTALSLLHFPSLHFFTFFSNSLTLFLFPSHPNPILISLNLSLYPVSLLLSLMHIDEHRLS